MSTVAAPPEVRRDRTGRATSTRTTVLRLLALAGLTLLVLAVTRSVSGADDITSRGTAGAALRLAVPILLAGLGGLWAERAGIVNIGLEGMMILGTWFGAWGSLEHGWVVGIVAGILGGALGGLLHAVATVSFGVDHVVSGVAINILGAGVARFLSALTFKGKEGGGVTQSPSVAQPPTFTVPGVSDGLQDVAAKHWFLLSDVCGVLGGLVTGLSLITVIAVLLVPVSFVVLWRTPFGLRLRSCGENPYAAESLGVSVYRYKYAGVIASGAFAGLAGAFLSLVASNFYREDQTGGRGYIGLAALIFGNWRPGGLAAGAGLFGFTDALQLRQGATSVHALLFAVALALALLALWLGWRRRFVAAGASVVVAVAFFLVYATTDSIPQQFTGATPYVTTLVVLAVFSQRLRPPAADGLPYRKGTAS